MKRRHEVNQLIQRKIEAIEVDEDVKEFVLEILNFERANWRFEKVHYSEPYDKLVHQFTRKAEGK